jgi:hypothetical protein
LKYCLDFWHLSESTQENHINSISYLYFRGTQIALLIHMKKLLTPYLHLLLCAFWAISCNPHDMETEYQVRAGHWGHLPELSTLAPTMMYLSHVKQNQTYKICLANYMVDQYPGIESEIKAAINIWAYYIGRSIDVEIVRANLRKTKPGEEDKKLVELYYRNCPRDIHLVIGEGHLTVSTIAETATYFSDHGYYSGKQTVSTFQRSLFLVSPESNPKIQWKSLAEVMGRELSEDDILEMMKKRNVTTFLAGKDELLTFKTMVHEFGHIWGLCDQYPLPGNTTNCDPAFATMNNEEHFHNEAMMARTGWISNIYLSDDDIEGIQQLAHRPAFAHDWPNSQQFRSIDVPQITKERPIAFAQINSVQIYSGSLKISMALKTNTPLIVKLRIRNERSTSWMSWGEFSLHEEISNSEFIKRERIENWLRPVEIELTLEPADRRMRQERIILNSLITTGTATRSSRVIK